MRCRESGLKIRALDKTPGSSAVTPAVSPAKTASASHPGAAAAKVAAAGAKVPSAEIAAPAEVAVEVSSAAISARVVAAIGGAREVLRGRRRIVVVRRTAQRALGKRADAIILMSLALLSVDALAALRAIVSWQASAPFVAVLSRRAFMPDAVALIMIVMMMAPVVSAAPSVPSVAAAPAVAINPIVAAPVPAGALPRLIVPTIIDAIEGVILRAFDRRRAAPSLGDRRAADCCERRCWERCREKHGQPCEGEKAAAHDLVFLRSPASFHTRINGGSRATLGNRGGSMRMGDVQTSQIGNWSKAQASALTCVKFDAISFASRFDLPSRPGICLQSRAWLQNHLRLRDKCGELAVRPEDAGLPNHGRTPDVDGRAFRSSGLAGFHRA